MIKRSLRTGKHKPRLTHGMTYTPTYSTWCNMLGRCNNPNNNRYYRYGARGIRVCKRWEKFENFLKDMGEKPKGMTLDRLDMDKDYKPSNCKWSTKDEQMNNTSRSVHYIYEGKKYSIAQLERHLGLTRGNLNYMLRKQNKSLEETINYYKQKGRIKNDR